MQLHALMYRRPGKVDDMTRLQELQSDYPVLTLRLWCHAAVHQEEGHCKVLRVHLPCWQGMFYLQYLFMLPRIACSLLYLQEADERAKDVAKAKKHTVPQIHAMLDLFDISRGSGEAGKKVLQDQAQPKRSCSPNDLARMITCCAQVMMEPKLCKAMSLPCTELVDVVQRSFGALHQQDLRLPTPHSACRAHAYCPFVLSLRQNLL